MPSNVLSQIVRLVTALNNANDPLPGQSVSSGTGAAQYPGMVGSRLELGPDEVRFKSSVGTLYGGIYQYVKTRLTDATALFLGAVVFWDPTATEDQYQVTTLESIGGTAGANTANFVAGIALNAVTLGNYTWIQVAGKATVKFRTTITGTPAVGCPVYAAGAGAGADVATADVLNGAGAATIAQVAQMQERYLGVAEATPVGAAASVVELHGLRIRV